MSVTTEKKFVVELVYNGVTMPLQVETKKQVL
jgi:hypothetical protein